jgi:tetraacyldisaccharide 4'-kinase
LATLLSLPWGGLMALRRRAYGAGALPTRKATLPVVSVGNLSLGGTGKSPLLLHLLHHLEAGSRHGLEDLLPELPAPVAVLSRGYGRNSRGWRLVSQGCGPLLDVDEAGDEPFMIAKRLPRAWVAVCEDRREGARRLAELGAGSILLDDGFQHLALRRDADLLLWDCAVDPEREAVLPFGRLREDPRAALAASALLFTRPSRELLPVRLEAFRALFGRAGRELPPSRVVESSVAGLADPEGGRRTAAAGLGRHGVFCGIAAPERFLDQAERLLGPPAWTRCWGDHHAFTDGDLDSLRRAVAEHRLRALVTTWKDAVRLPAGHGLPLRVAEQELRIQGVETYLAAHA